MAEVMENQVTHNKENWKYVPLKGLTSKIGSGATPRGGSNNYKLEGISLIRSQNVLDFSFSIGGLAFIDDDQASELSNVIVEEGDILLNITGDSVARCCMVPRSVLPARVNQHVAIVRANHKHADPSFIYYCLQASKEELLMQSEIGATRNALTKGMIEEFHIKCPPLPEQRAIAAVLSSLDDKIDLLHRQNKTLEAMAETLFRQWFVEEAGEDWEEGTLGDICSIIASGGTPSTKVDEYYNGDIDWYSTKELNDCFLFGSTKKISEIGLSESAAKLFPTWTVVIAIYAAPTVGRLGILTRPSCFNQAACGLVSKEGKSTPEFLYLFLLSKRADLNSMASGSAQQNLNVLKIKEYPVLIPDVLTLKKFQDCVHPLFERLLFNGQQICKLEKLRDTLLPKLMSGEVRVKYE